MISLQKLVKQIQDLKPMPAVANQILAKVDEPGASMQDIAQIIQYDPAITANVLKTCNSAFFGLKHPAESIKDAVNMMGIDQIVELVLLKAGKEIFTGAQAGYGLKKGEMWKYSVTSAVIAKQAAVKLKVEHKNTIFTAALIKDIGKVILEKYVSKNRSRITDLVDYSGMSFREAEKEVLGIDHTELGAMIAKMWKFSPRMVKIIKNHHLSDDVMIKDKDVAVVYLSDCICMMIGMGTGVDGLAYRFKDDVVKQLGMSPDDLAMIIAQMGSDMQEIEQLLNMV